MHRHYRIGLSLVLFSAAPVWGSVASVDQQNVFVSVVGCADADVSAARFIEMARAEIAPQILEVGTAAKESQAVSVQVLLCQGSAHTARLVFAIGARQVAERIVDLSDVDGELRARTLAVTLAEVLSVLRAGTTSASETEDELAAPASSLESITRVESPSNTLSAAPAQAAEGKKEINSKADTIAIPTARASVAVSRGIEGTDSRAPVTSARAPRSHLASGIALREFVAPSSPLVGPWMALHIGRTTAEVQFLTLNRELSLGTVGLYNANLAASYDLLETRQTAVLALRARAELGMTWAKGAPGDLVSSRGRATSNLQVAALLELGLSSPLTSRVGLDCGLSAGVARGVIATSDGNSIASTDGFLLGGALGLYWGLSDR